MPMNSGMISHMCACCQVTIPLKIRLPGHDDHGDDDQEERYLKGDQLRGAPHTTDHGELVVGGPATDQDG